MQRLPQINQTHPAPQTEASQTRGKEISRSPQTEPSLPARPYQLMVVELTDVCQRRDPSKPNLLVVKTQSEPKSRFQYLLGNSSEKWYSGFVSQLREDLVDTRMFTSAADASTALRDLVGQLSTEGYTVNRDTRIWSVYVIQLDSQHIDNPGKGYVYVGETSKPHEIRLAEHLEKKRNSNGRLYSSVVAKYGIRLRPELAPTSNTYFDQESSRIAESSWASHLRNIGYTVEGGH